MAGSVGMSMVFQHVPPPSVAYLLAGRRGEGEGGGGRGRNARHERTGEADTRGEMNNKMIK